MLAKPKKDDLGEVRDKLIISEVFADIVQLPPPQDPYSKLMFEEREMKIKKNIRVSIDEASKKFQ